MEVDRDPCQDVSSIKRSLKSTATSQRLTRRASLLSIPHLPQVSALSLPNQTRAVQRKGPFFSFFFFAYSSHLFMVYWTGHFPCLLEQLLQRWPHPPLYLTGVGKTTCVQLPVKFPSAGEAPLVTSCTAFTGTIWIIYSLNLAQPWHFDVWCPQALALTI